MTPPPAASGRPSRCAEPQRPHHETMLALARWWPPTFNARKRVSRSNSKPLACGLFLLA